MDMSMRHMMKNCWAFLLLAVCACSCADKEEYVGDGKVALYGIILDASSGLPVPNVTVTLYEGSGAMASLGGAVGSSVTGDDGAFSFVDVAPYYRHTIVASHPGYERLMRDVSLSPGDNAQISFSIVPK